MVAMLPVGPAFVSRFRLPNRRCSNKIRGSEEGHAGSMSTRTSSNFNEAAEGGHFAAWEVPEVFSGELRAAFKPLRAAEGGKQKAA